MKAIILAAGLGTRLGKYTENLPKCMLNFAGMPLIERQIKTFRNCGIKKIIVVGGYMNHKINIPGVNYYFNENFSKTNMVETLFSAEREFEDIEDNIIVSYGDIIFDEETLKKIIACEKDICVAVDDNWQEYWKTRFNGKLEDVESMHIGEDGNIMELGTPNCQAEDCHARYVGMIKFSKEGAKVLREIYHENKKKYWDKDEKWLNSKSFKQAYMTDMLQSIINSGFKVWPAHINGGWLEFDTEQDYELANKWLKEGTLNRFIKIDYGK